MFPTLSFQIWAPPSIFPAFRFHLKENCGLFQKQNTTQREARERLAQRGDHYSNPLARSPQTNAILCSLNKSKEIDGNSTSTLKSVFCLSNPLDPMAPEKRKPIFWVVPCHGFWMASAPSGLEAEGDLRGTDRFAGATFCPGDPRKRVEKHKHQSWVFVGA